LAEKSILGDTYFMAKFNFKNIGLPFLWQPSASEIDASKSYVLIVLHGRGDSPEGFNWLKSELAIPGLSILALQAPDPYFDGFSWYDLPPKQLHGILRSRKSLEKAFAEIFGLGFKPEHCFLFGFSQGCLMTLEFGGRFTPVLAGYIGVSGYCYDASAILNETTDEIKKAPWLITHGTEDEVLEIEETRPQIKQLIDGGFNLEWREYTKTHTVDLNKELSYIREWITQKIKRT
jgi:phospholipase/carboxylesterase